MANYTFKRTSQKDCYIIGDIVCGLELHQRLELDLALTQKKDISDCRAVLRYVERPNMTCSCSSDECKYAQNVVLESGFDSCLDP